MKGRIEEIMCKNQGEKREKKNNKKKRRRMGCQTILENS
jgi:hypothetical protein